MNSKVRNVAIVEDDELVRTATVSLVRSAGLGAIPFRSALDFLEMRSEAFGCIISDIHMPGMSGLELQENLRASGSTVPLILVTAYPTEQIRSRALENGAHCFLEKPCDPDALVDCLAQIFGPLDG